MAKNAMSSVTKSGREVQRQGPAVRPTKQKRGTDLTSSRGKVESINYKQPGDNIGVRYDTQLQAAKLVQSGLPFGAVERFHKASGLTLDRIKQAAGISEGSFARRKKSGRLSQQESERMVRLGRVFDHAASLYDGDQIGAREWLETPIPALGNQRPLDLAQTEPGAREVEDLIGRIAHGIVS